MSYKDGKCVCFDDKELNLLKKRIEKNPTMEQKLYPDEALALLARLEAAEEVARWANAFIPKMEIDRKLGIDPDQMPNRLRWAYEAWRKVCGE